MSGKDTTYIPLDNTEHIARGYSDISKEYADRFENEWADRPVERHLMHTFAELTLSQGNALCDLGCGPGHSSSFFHNLGFKVKGFDIAEGMISEARDRYPHITFNLGNLIDLPVPDMSFAGVASVFSIIHLAEEELIQAIQECYRILQYGGYLLLIFQTGSDPLHIAEVFGKEVNLTYLRPDFQEMQNVLESVNFSLYYTGLLKRHGDQTADRAFIIAQKDWVEPVSSE